MLGAAVANDAAAGVDLPTGEFHLAISPSDQLLDCLWNDDYTGVGDEYYDVKYEEMCDNPHVRVRNRNTPAVRIDNLSSTMSPLTQFTLTINEGPYIFGNGDGSSAWAGYFKPTTYTDAGVQITDSQVSSDKKTLTISFNGLGQNTKAIFHVDLDLDPNDSASDDYFPYPDYRNVLFGAPLEDGDSASNPFDDPTTPATVTATFGPPDGRTLGPASLVQLTEAPTYQNDSFRPYGVADPIEVLTFQIPEPSSVGLALGAGLAAALVARRSRRRG
jgi:hypothetical protein